MNRRNALLATAAAVVLFAACDQSATDVSTSGSTELAVQSALIGGGSAFPDGGPQPAIMGRLVEAAFAKIRKDNGADSAKAARANLQTAVKTARDAHAANDTAAARAALVAIHETEAQIVVSALGSDAVDRALAFAGHRVDALNDRIAKANANDHDLPRLQSLAASMTQILADANASAAAGDYVSALIGAVKVTEGLHIVEMHRRDGVANLPLDTTRVRRHTP
jgi:hypothetical protein